MQDKGFGLEVLKITELLRGSILFGVCYRCKSKRNKFSNSDRAGSIWKKCHASKQRHTLPYPKDPEYNE